MIIISANYKLFCLQMQIRRQRVVSIILILITDLTMTMMIIFIYLFIMIPYTKYMSNRINKEKHAKNIHLHYIQPTLYSIYYCNLVRCQVIYNTDFWLKCTKLPNSISDSDGGSHSVPPDPCITMVGMGCLHPQEPYTYPLLKRSTD